MRAKPLPRLVVACTTIVLLAACTDEPAPLPTPPACPSSGVALTAGQVEPAMGLRAMRVEMVNCGSQTYTAQGYPALRVLDADRQPLEVTIAQGTAKVSPIEGFDGPPRPAPLAPGDRAAAVVVWRNTVTDATKPATTGTDLEVSPAPNQPAQILSPTGGIDLGTTGILATSPWVPLP